MDLLRKQISSHPLNHSSPLFRTVTHLSFFVGFFSRGTPFGAACQKRKKKSRAMLGVTIPKFGQSKTILLQVPPGNNVDSDYKLRVEGAGRGGGAIIFENETMLEFSRQFLSVSISTNRAIYSGTQKIEIRAIMLTTALQPYTGIADLFIIGKSATTLQSMMNAKLRPHRFLALP